MAITYRSIKGSALTADEVDANFQDLSDDLSAIGAGFIPLSGTTAGNEVTGNLEFDDSVKLNSKTNPDNYIQLYDGTGKLKINTTSSLLLTGEVGVTIDAGNGDLNLSGDAIVITGDSGGDFLLTGGHLIFDTVVDLVIKTNPAQYFADYSAQMISDRFIPDIGKVNSLISAGVSTSVSDTIYGSGWNGVTTIAPSKNAVYDKIETLLPLSAGSSYPMTGDILFTASKGIDTTSAGASDTLNIGTTNADIINIGRSGAVINLIGTTLYENVTNLQVVDKLITLNKGGAASSGGGAGFEVEENSSITGYIKVTSARSGWDIKAPSITGIATISLGGLSTSRTYSLPNASGTLALLSDVASYLPLAGGDLTGTVTVTTAGFYHELGGGYLLLENTGATKGIIQFADTGGSNFTLDVSFNTLTANRVIYFPDANGTLLVASMILGTASRISVTGATSPVIDIDAAYVGQTSITTLGTIATGTWSATAIAANKGGTGTTSYAVGDLLYADTTSTLAKLADVAVGSYLRSGGVTTAPLWSTLKLPNAATANSIVFASSTNTYGESANFTWDGNLMLLKHASLGATVRLDAGNGVPGLDFYSSGSQIGQFKINGTEAYFLANGSRNFIAYLGNSFYQGITILNNGRASFGNIAAPAAMLDVAVNASTVGFKLTGNATGTSDLVALYSSTPTKITYIDYLGRLVITDTTFVSSTSTVGAITVSGGIYCESFRSLGGIYAPSFSNNGASGGGIELSVIGLRSGTNLAGGAANIIAGSGTGNGTASTFNVQTATPVASGTTTQSLATRFTINAFGITITASADTASASNNSLVNDAGVLKWKDNGGTLNLLY